MIDARQRAYNVDARSARTSALELVEEEGVDSWDLSQAWRQLVWR
ncbi:putative membrane protein [Bradyrhizobium sp. USDA 4341]